MTVTGGSKEKALLEEMQKGTPWVSGRILSWRNDTENKRVVFVLEDTRGHSIVGAIPSDRLTILDEAGEPTDQPPTGWVAFKELDSGPFPVDGSVRPPSGDLEQRPDKRPMRWWQCLPGLATVLVLAIILVRYLLG